MFKMLRSNAARVPFRSINLYAYKAMQQNTSFLSRHEFLRDMLNIAGFVAAVFIGAWLINSLVFRSFNVSGPSMEPTMHTGDRLIVSRLPLTASRINGQPYIPERGEIIVFRNPHFGVGQDDEYIVKRVLGLPGERVVVENGTITVYNNDHPTGFEPDKSYDGPTSPTAGSAIVNVPVGELFVAGDHREENFSLDSRNGLGTIPLEDIIGPVSMRIYPLDTARWF